MNFQHFAPDSTAQERAEQLSATCFLNALLREKRDYPIVALPPELAELTSCREGLKITCFDGQAHTSLWIPIRRASLVGRHSYGWPFYFENEGKNLSRAEFSTWVSFLAKDMGSKLHVPIESETTFLDRVDESRAAIADTLEKRAQAIWEGAETSPNFCQAEQGLIVGHSFHPTPRSRGGWQPAEREQYCPEMGGAFALRWFAVHPDIYFEKESLAWSKGAAFETMWEFDPEVRELLKSSRERGFRPLPMHPWQARHLLNLEPIKAALADRKIIDLGACGPLWKPTSSLRSLYCEQAPFMLKFSLSVRLTNSIRNLLEHEVERGLQVHEVLNSPEGEKLLRRYPNFNVLFEPAFAALKGQDGRLIPESIVVCRENPFRVGEKADALVLATLTEDDAYGRGTLIGRQIAKRAAALGESKAELARRWFGLYCQRVLEPLIMAQADYGILFGAHQQNILIGFKDELPDSLYFRDCQGTGYTHLGYETMSQAVSSLALDNGNVLSSDRGNALIIYYLIINASFNVIHAVAEGGGLGEDELLGELREFIRSLRKRGVRDSSCLDTLLDQDFLLHKGNFFCSLTGLNENMTPDPLAIYTKISNPLYRGGMPA